MPLISSLLVLAGMFAVMIWLNIALAGVILAMVPVLFLVTAHRSKKIQTVARKNRKREGAMAATASESITAIKTVQSLAVHDKFVASFSEHNNATQKQGAKIAKMSAGLERSVDMLIAVGTAVALWFGAHLVINGDLSPGELLVFLFYFKRAFRPMRDFAKYSARLAKASAAAERVLEILRRVPSPRDDASAVATVARKNRKREGAMAATASESITAIKTVQSLAVHDKFVASFSEHNNATQKQGAKIAKMSAGLERSVDMLIAVGTAVALWFGAHLVINGDLSPGELLVFLFYFKRAFRPMRDFAKYSARLAKASAAAERVLEILRRVPSARDDASADRAPVLKGQIQFEAVDFHYADGSRGITGANFTINAGETVLITGPSGSGKSTLLNLLLRLHEPQEGHIRVDGRDIREFALDSYRNRLSVVLQDGLLFSASVAENIAILRPEATDEEILKAAKLANADEFIRALPDGYDTYVGERGVSLSRGQRQRIAIARAAIRPASILILDEPTTGLDTANVNAISRSIQKLARNTTTLLVSHHALNNLPVDRVFIVESGQVTESDRKADRLKGNQVPFHTMWSRA